MSEASRKWRCPYCDGLNDWQNAICEICGDGRRDEAEPAPKAEKPVEVPKTYTPKARETAGEAPRIEPKKEAKTTFAPPPPPPEPEPKKKKGKAGVLVAAILVALAAFGGRQLADGFVSSVNQNRPTATPLNVIQTVAPKSPAAKASAPTAEPRPSAAQDAGGVAGQVIATFDAPDKAIPSIESITLEDNGSARVRLSHNNCTQKSYVVRYCILKDRSEDPALAVWRDEADRIIDINRWHPFMTAKNTEKGGTTLTREDASAQVRVFPDCWMQFYVIGEGGFHNASVWTTGPVRMPETVSTVQPPLRLKDVKLGFLKDGTYDIGSYYSLTSAQHLNDTLQTALEERKEKLWAEYSFEFTGTADALIDWCLGKQVNAVLYAPDFVEIGYTYDASFSHSQIDGNTAKRNLQSTLKTGSKEAREDLGWYPPGDYRMVYYFDGVPVGSYAFTLTGKGGASSWYTSASSAATSAFPLKVGSRGEEVRKLQKALMALSLSYKGPADGIFGRGTQQAVYEQQDAAGFDRTGEVDLEFYKAVTLRAGVLTEADFN